MAARRKNGGSILQRLRKGHASSALVGVTVAAALLLGASIGWWGASRIADAPPQKVTRQEPPPAPQSPPQPAPQAAPEPALPAPEPEVAALPPPVLPAPAAAEWRRNAIAFTVEPGKPMVAIVIDDMGVDAKRSARIIDLPPPLTTSFLSYAHNLSAQARAARAAGHELMLHMPMEPFGSGYDPGPDVLLTSMSDEAIRARLRQSLASFSGYVGINNHMGSRFTADERGMHAVMEVLKTDGLLFLDSLTSARSVGVKVATAEQVPNLVRNVFLDDSPDPAAIREQLRRVEEQARKSGAAIAIGHPRETTLDALVEWLPKARAKGFQLVPISALAKAKYGP